jgi:hypothetical protein
VDLGNELLTVRLITRVSRAIAYNGPAVWLVAVCSCAMAGSPIDFVSVAGFVMVQDNLISVFKLCSVSRQDVVIRADEGN